MAYSLERRPRTSSALFTLLLIRVAGGASGLIASYAISSTVGGDGGARVVGGLSSVSNMAEALAAVLASQVAFVRNRTVRVVLGLAAAMGASLAARQPGMAALWTVRICDGFLAGAATALVLSAVLSKSHDEVERRGRLTTAFESVVVFGLALGSVLAALTWRSWELAAYGWVALLYVGAAGSLYMSDSPNEVPRKRRFGRPDRYILALFALAVSASMWLSQIGFLLTGPKWPYQLLPGSVNERGVTAILLGYLLVAGAGLGVWSRLLDRIGLARSLTLAKLGAVLAPVALFAFDRTGFGFGGWLTGGAYVLLVMAQVGLVPAILSSASAHGNGADYAPQAAWYVVAASAGNIFGPSLGGVLSDFRGAEGLCFGSLVLALVAAGALTSKKNFVAIGPS